MNDKTDFRVMNDLQKAHPFTKLTVDAWSNDSSLNHWFSSFSNFEPHLLFIVDLLAAGL
jgi:hypothetical protein